MRLPKRSTKHVTNPQDPIGWVKHGRVKVKDGDSGKVGWRQVRRGMLSDFDGEPTSTRHNLKDAHDVNHHSVHKPKSNHTTRNQE